MKSHVLVTRKCINVKLDKEVHASFRFKLLERGITMQDAMDEFARLIADDDQRALGIVERLATRKAQAELTAMSEPKDRSRKLSELDAETLYNLINHSEEDDADDKGRGDPGGNHEAA